MAYVRTMKRALCLLPFFLIACGDDSPGADATDTADTSSTDTPDTLEAPDASDALETDTRDDATDVGSDADTGPAGPPTAAELGFTEVRLIAHLHSAYSHDACDNQGLDADGNPNATCVQRMKRALCTERIGLAFMTDHPSFMREQPFGELLYADLVAAPPGDDRLLLGEDGVTPWGVRFACDVGEGGPDGRVTLLVGFEGTHTMPLGIRRHLDPISLTSVSFTEDTDPADLRALTTEVRSAGGHVAIAHSEESDISAQRLIDHDVAAMELYNFHANFKEVLGTGLATALIRLEDFLDPVASLPDPNLTALVMLDIFPVEALRKWREVAAHRPITAFAGSDVHENVSFEPACKDTDACDGLAETYPNLVDYLKIGGPIWQADGQRLDGYSRIFRWVQNRVLVAPGVDPNVPQNVENAFFAGAAYSVFEVLGEPRGVSLVALGANDSRFDLGASAPLTAGMTLWARSPDLPQPTRFARWTDGTLAKIESVLWRLDPAGPVEVLRWSEPGTWKSLPITTPGVYHLEVWLTPLHLASELGPAAPLAETAYRWVETNAIRFVGLMPFSGAR
jgi:hypothetical protein